MITLIRGNSQQLKQYFCQPNFEHGYLWLEKKQPLASAWQPIADFLSQLEQHLGKTEIQHQLSLNYSAASFAYPEKIHQLSSTQSAMRHLYCARTDSHLSHNAYLHHPLFDAWARIINTLLHNPKLYGNNTKSVVTVVLPDCHNLIGPVNAIISTLIRSFPQGRVRFIIGHDNCPSTPCFDNNGINHDIRASNTEDVQMLIQMADQVIELHNKSPFNPFNPPQRISKTLVNHKRTALTNADVPNDNILKSHALLETSELPLTPEQINRIIDAMKLAFNGTDFQNTLSLGLSLLAQQVQFDQPQQARFHTLLSLAAHNRQLDSNDARLTHFLEQHYLAAFEAQVNPAMRSILCYRLAQLFGQYIDNIDKALRWAQKALTCAASTRLPKSQQLYCNLWALNIKSDLLARSGHPQQAFELGASVFDNIHNQCHHLETTVAKCLDSSAILWQREFFCTLQVLRRNLFKICDNDSHYQQFRPWLVQMERDTPDSGEFKRDSYYEWATYFEAIHQPKSMVDALKAGFECLKKAPDPILYLDYCRLAIRAYNKTGDIVLAWQHLSDYCQALEQTTLTWLTNDDIITNGQLFLRCCSLDELQLFERQIATTLQNQLEDEPRKIELQSLQALFFAQQQQPLQTKTAVNKTIELTVKTSVLAQRMRIARIAGNCYQQLGKPNEAALAFKQALTLAQNETHQKNQPKAKHIPCPQELFLSLLGLQQVKSVHCGLMEKTLKVLPDALKAEQVWWQLESMLTLLCQLAQTEPNTFADLVERKPLTKLIDAAGQRKDCQTALALLMAHLAQVGEHMPVTAPLKVASFL